MILFRDCFLCYSGSNEPKFIKGDAMNKISETQKINNWF